MIAKRVLPHLPPEKVSNYRSFTARGDSQLENADSVDVIVMIPHVLYILSQDHVDVKELISECTAMPCKCVSYCMLQADFCDSALQS